MNLHGLARRAVSAVNPEITAALLRSTGSAPVGGSLRQTPQYAPPVTISIQVQPLSPQDLKHPNMLNVQGVTRAVYAFGSLQGVNREAGIGGDLLQFPETVGGANKTWLVHTVLETWPTGWCKVGVILQVNAP